MATETTEYKERLRQLAELMLAVSGESVTMMKRNAPEQALKLKRQDEWGIYLEFLKIMFNLTDRLVALHIPLKDQMEFMNGLEDAVTQQLKQALEPAFGNNADQMEIMMTIGTTAPGAPPARPVTSWQASQVIPSPWIGSSAAIARWTSFLTMSVYSAFTMAISCR